MSPRLSWSDHMLSGPRNITAKASAASELGHQWSHPADVLSVLLIVGGDVVNKALAQLAGGPLTPVTFSFGWVSYSVSSILSSLSDGKLMPAVVECPCIVVTAKNGYLRTNSSWVISRIVRDYESWMDASVRARVKHILDDRHRYLRTHVRKGTSIPRPRKSGLCVSVYEPSRAKVAGIPSKDLIYWSGFIVVVVQIAVACVPLFVSRDWSILLITALGTVFALLTGSLPQWKAEKWFCRRNARNTYVITRGNGSQHAIAVLGNGWGLDLEDLAVGADNLGSTGVADIATRICLVALSCSWICLLVTTAGLARNTWYLLSVGGIGMIQNLSAAGWRRNPSALGVHLEFRRVFGHMETMGALLEVEAEYPTVGRSILPVFFPGELLPHEVAQWEALMAKAEAARARTAAQTRAAQDLAVTTVQDVPTSWILHARGYESTR